MVRNKRNINNNIKKYGVSTMKYTFKIPRQSLSQVATIQIPQLIQNHIFTLKVVFVVYGVIDLTLLKNGIKNYPCIIFDQDKLFLLNNEEICENLWRTTTTMEDMYDVQDIQQTIPTIRNIEIIKETYILTYGV